MTANIAAFNELAMSLKRGQTEARIQRGDTNISLSRRDQVVNAPAVEVVVDETLKSYRIGEEEESRTAFGLGKKVMVSKFQINLQGTMTDMEATVQAFSRIAHSQNYSILFNLSPMVLLQKGQSSGEPVPVALRIVMQRPV